MHMCVELEIMVGNMHIHMHVTFNLGGHLISEI